MASAASSSSPKCYVSSEYGYNITDTQKYWVKIYEDKTIQERQSKEDLPASEIIQSSECILPIGAVGKNGIIARLFSYLPIPILAGVGDILHSWDILNRLISNNWEYHERSLEETTQVKNGLQVVKITKKITPIELSLGQKVKIIAAMIGLFVRGLLEAVCLGFLFIIPDVIYNAASSNTYEKEEKELWAPIINPLGTYFRNFRTLV